VDNIVFQPNQHLDDGANLQDAEPYEGQQPPQALVVHGRAPCWVAGGDDPFGDDDDMMMMRMHLEDPEDPVDLEDLEVKMDFSLLMMDGL